MNRARTWVALSSAAALLSLGSTCTVVEEGEPADVPYGEESAEQQTMDEQMEEVDEQINR